jgi:hypothetical protein
MLAATVSASAQPIGQAPVPRTTPSPELDFRLGALWPEDGAEPHAAVGLRLALRPFMSLAGGRFSLQFTGDFRSFGGNNAYDEFYQLHRRITRNRFVLGAALGFDVLRTEQVAMEIRGGVALVRTRTNFLIDSSLGFRDDGDLWENVCQFESFREHCRTDYEATPVVAAGLRRDIVQSGATYIGVDYTWLGINQHILVGAIGLRLR